MHRILSLSTAENMIRDTMRTQRAKFQCIEFFLLEKIKDQSNVTSLVGNESLWIEVTGRLTLDLIHKLLAKEQKFDALNFSSAQLKIRDTMRTESENSMH